MARVRLNKGDISLKELLTLSYGVYGKEVDNKAKRTNLDVKGGKITSRRNMEYNRSSRMWEQTGREVRIDFMVRSKPVSYKKQDTLSTHYYPITFLIKNIDKGIDSPFRWRTGSFKKPRFPKRKISEGKTTKEKDIIRKQNNKIKEDNIRRGIQLQWVFDLCWVCEKYGLLFGPDVTNGKPPVVKNKKLIPFFDKHSLWVMENLLSPLLTTHKEKLEELIGPYANL